MISRHTWSTLNIRQKILKTAQAVRAAEAGWKDDGEKALKGVLLFLGLQRTETHPKLRKAAAILQAAVDTVTADRERSSQLKALNFCYHDLLSLNGVEEDEQYFLSEDDLFDAEDSAGQTARFGNAAILDDLRSPFNAGSVFRSADCFGTGELALCGITPRPPHPKLEKTAMGTTAWVPWKGFDYTAEAVAYYRREGYRIAAAERSSRSVPLTEARFPEKTAFIFGNEEFGITEAILRSADLIVEIPRMGRKNSMNVAGAFAVVMYAFMASRKAGKNY